MFVFGCCETKDSFPYGKALHRIFCVLAHTLCSHSSFWSSSIVLTADSCCPMTVLALVGAVFKRRRPVHCVTLWNNLPSAHVSPILRTQLPTNISLNAPLNPVGSLHSLTFHMKNTFIAIACSCESQLFAVYFNKIHASIPSCETSIDLSILYSSFPNCFPTEIGSNRQFLF
ncbi:unnamed protein product [Dicrocoelium dendriticum]|nr:unnamed protein product [Dicrocoelium dendriticum]